jgi:hypothetical protein
VTKIMFVQSGQTSLCRFNYTGVFRLLLLLLMKLFVLIGRNDFRSLSLDDRMYFLHHTLIEP